MITNSLPHKVFSNFKDKLFALLTLSCCYMLTVNVNAQSEAIIKLTLDQAIEYSVKNNLPLQNAELKNKQALLLHNNKIIIPVTVKHQEQNHDPILISTNIKPKHRAGIIQKVLSDLHLIKLLETNAEVKAAYLNWQYHFAIYQLKKQELHYYKQFDDKPNLHYKLGDIDKLEYVTAQTEYSEIFNNYQDWVDEYTLTQIKLCNLTKINNAIIPADTSLRLYKINRTTASSFYLGNSLLSTNVNRLMVAKANLLASQSRYFKKKHEIQHYQYVVQLAENDVENQKYKIHTTVEQLILQLNKYFRKIRHYENFALPESDLIINVAKKRFELEEINYETYLQSISCAYNIKYNYLENINKYNQLAVQLEIYED